MYPVSVFLLIFVAFHRVLAFLYFPRKLLIEAEMSCYIVILDMNSFFLFGSSLQLISIISAN
jgi:hypothetical protein